MISKILLPLLALGMLGLAVWHVVRAQQEKPKPDPPRPPTQAPFASAIAGAGLIEAQSENLSVGAPASGLVAEVLVRVGDQVGAGKPLFRLDGRSWLAELKARQAALHTAQKQLARLESLPRLEEVPGSAARVREARANLGEKEYFVRRAEEKVMSEDERTRRQHAEQIAREQLARAQAEHALLLAGTAKADLAVARAQVEQARALVDQAETELERLTVRAPIAATVLEVNVHQGESVDALRGQALAVLGDVRRLHVRVEIDEHNLPRFRPGAGARGALRGDARREFGLTFVRVVPHVLPKRVLTGQVTERIDTRVLQILYALDPGVDGLYVGQQLDVFIAAEGPP
jgi:multidrug resistance efflux pump